MANPIDNPTDQAEPNISPDATHISSPASTGGAGNVFEQHVDAYWLAQLLVGGIAPILIDSAIVEVHFQTEHLGWRTDDVLVVGQNGSGQIRKLICQVKRTFTISAIDEECKQAIRDFWADFTNAKRFASGDCLALITQRGTNTLLGHFGGLLDCAHAACDASDFEHRLATPGLVSSKAIQYCGDLRSIIGEVEGRDVAAGDIWTFLRVLHVLSLDLATPTRQHEATIKSLLAYTAIGSNQIETAANSWNALLALAGTAMGSAATFRRENLPEELQQKHGAGLMGQGILAALRDHSTIVLDGIRSTIGTGPHLVRSALVQQVIGKLGESQVVLLSGTAGTGKSAIAKDAIGVLAGAYFTFAFRAEEFAQPHFDATLHNSQIPGNTTALSSVLGGQDRKVVLIESVERLLEKSTRDAFTDLLRLAARDKSMCIILTCRDYSTDLVRSCFLVTAAVDHSVVEIPLLSDEELAEVEAVHPKLSLPLGNPVLRRILRNPYILDKALRIDWSADRFLPRSEREFRELFWREIVRVDHHAAEGMPARREQVFLEIALRRARGLSVYVKSTNLDPAVIAVLRADSLVISSEQNSNLVAPAHDVLEDWSILRWIEEQHLTSGASLVGLFEAIGQHPATRRGYRKWVAELIEYDPPSADGLFKSAVTDTRVPASFRDDTLVSLLRANSSPQFLEQHATDLLSNNNALLRRVIHLVRVACVKTPAWLEGKGALFNVPDGPAWGAVLRLALTNLKTFEKEDSLLLLGLIEDWARGVTAWDPYPEGAEFASGIAYSLLPRFNSYSAEDEQKRLLQAISKIPKADPTRFEVLLRGGKVGGERRNRISENLQELIFEGWEGMPTARDLPDLLVSVLRTDILCSESDSQNRRFGYAPPLELETLFGLKEGLRHGYFPASAYRTPVIHLLRYHPLAALDFLVDVFNHSADWYANPRVQDGIEPPFEIELRFEDGSMRQQWCNGRLWAWYRGMSVGPYVLQSYLMALERWLLEVAKGQPDSLDAVLLSILKRSESGALTAVAASVATAFPFQAGQTLLALLRSRECVLLDRHRMAAESQTLSGVLGLSSLTRAENRIYEDERKEADRLPHRKSDLEDAVKNLQLTPLAARVQEILDEHRKAMPPIEKQSEDDRVWRLAIHRMDLRQYSVREHVRDPRSAQAEQGNSAEGDQQYIRLDLSDPEPDVMKMVQDNAPRFERMQTRLGLVMWGLKVFKYEDADRFDPADWRARLEQAQTTEDSSFTEELERMGAEGGPGIVAAVCVRDHWDEMSEDERAWCIGLVCSEVRRSADDWAYTLRAQRFEMSADRVCARVLPVLLSKELSPAERLRVNDTFAIALTHPIDEVRWYATWGVAEQMWSIDRGLALRCINALATEATANMAAHDQEDKKEYRQRRPHEVIAAESAARVREGFWKPGSIAEDAYARMNLEDWYGAEANNHILAILGKAPAEPAAITGFTRAAQTLVKWWDEKDDHKERRRERNHEAESLLSQLIQQFAMVASPSDAEQVLQPILDAVDRHEDEIHWFVKGLIGIEDQQVKTDRFWFLWQMFADRVKRANWLEHLGDRYSTGAQLISAIFLGTWWKENVRHWRSLEGHAHRLNTLFDSLPPSSEVLDDYVRFLYHVGEQSLPDAFVRIAKRLKVGDANEMLAKSNTVFMLEVLLQRHVYSKPLALKSNHEFRDAVLFLLDLLVESGSSASFRMRDDFVTPISIG